MVSLCSRYYQRMLAQGLVVGVGIGCIFLPSITIVPQWYSPKYRTLALGVVATGSGVGGIIYTLMFHYILASAGFGWAARAIGFVSLGTNVTAIMLMRYRSLPPQKRRLIDLSMFKERTYIALCLGQFFAFIGLYIPIFFIQSYALAKEHGSSTLVFWLIPILTASSIPGRILPNLLAEKIGNLNVLILMVTSCALPALCWIAANFTGGVVAISILYGFPWGGFVSLLPPITVSTAPNMKNLGTRMGMSLAFASLEVLVGNSCCRSYLDRYRELFWRSGADWSVNVSSQRVLFGITASKDGSSPASEDLTWLGRAESCAILRREAYCQSSTFHSTKLRIERFVLILSLDWISRFFHCLHRCHVMRKRRDFRMNQDLRFSISSSLRNSWYIQQRFS